MPLDVLLLILRLLTIKDAIALFATCRKLCLTECRAFWLYANIDMDLLPCAPGRPPIDYRTLSTPLLRSRSMEAWSIHIAWRRNALQPKRVRVVPVDSNISEFLWIPWTRVMVVLVGAKLFLQDWSSGARVPVPLSQDATLSRVSPRVFWTGSESGWVLVHCFGIVKVGEVNTRLQLFAVDPALMSVSFLTSVVVPHSVSGVDLRGDHLAVLGCTARPRSSVIRSFRVVLEPNCAANVEAVLRIKPPVNHGEIAFAILDEERFLLICPTRVAVYNLSIAASKSPSVDVPWCRPLWAYNYSQPDILTRPIVGPIIARTDGTIWFSISSGAYLRCVLITPSEASGGPDSYAVIEKRLAYEVPYQLGISIGCRIGVFGRPYISSTAFTTFTTSSMFDEKDSLHPFFYRGDHPTNAKGSVVFAPGTKELLDVDSLQVDEDQGRIMFLVHSHVSNPVSKLIVLELV
ncbi:hypothetical protein C8R47DRAFT_1209164 [Mycena vitilis]|nr:hypothetical protein C8R47DRAFT_1209164 [Mycena vitilis]